MQQSLILITIIFMDLLTGMEFDIFVPSFPELQHQFHLTPFWVEALLSVNFIGYCISLFFVGSIADRYGRKPIILLGLMTFILGSVLCLYSGEYITFLVGRLLQGVGIAGPAILSFLIVADSYPIKKQQFLLAILNGTINLSIAFAPIIGSYLTLYFHWQGNFTALIILGFMTFIMTLWFIPSYKLPLSKETLALQGYATIFQSKYLMLLIINILFTYVPYWIFVGMSPLLYIKDLGVSLEHFGYYQGSLAFVFALGSILYGLIITSNDFEQETMLTISFSILLSSLFIILGTTIMNSVNPLLITLSLMPFIVGQIIPSTILYPLCLNYNPHVKGRVSALIQAFRFIVASIGLQIAGYFYQGSFRHIGIIIILFILIAVITLFFVLKNLSEYHIN